MTVGNKNNDVKHCLHVWRWGTHFYKVLWRHNCHIIFAACQKEDYAGWRGLHWQWTLWEIIVTWDSDARPQTCRASPAPTAFGQTQPDYWHWHFAFTQYVGGWWSPNIMLVEIKCKESQKYHNWQVAGTWWRLHYLQLMLRPRRKHNNWQ